MTRWTAVLLLILFAHPAPGQAPKPPVPAAPLVVKVKAPALAVLRGPAAGDVTWVYDERQLPAAQVYADAAGKVLVLSAAGGTYHVVCVSHAADGFRQQAFLVTFEGGPGPHPPDSLDVRLERAYEADKAAGKATADLKFLAAVYTQAGGFLKVPTTVTQAYQIVDFAVAQAVPAGELPAVLREIDAYLQQVVPRTPDAPLTDALRDALRAVFGDVSRAVTALLGPRPPPIPPGPEVKPGVRQVLLIRETAAGTPALARLIVALRVGVHAEWLKGRGHQLTILDDDAVGPDGQPTPALAKWRPHYQGLKLPALLIADPAGNMLHAAPLADGVTAEQVIEAVKKTGGG